MTVINNTKYSTEHLQELADACLQPSTHKDSTVDFNYRDFDVGEEGWCRLGKTDGYKSERRNSGALWRSPVDFRLYVPKPRYWDDIRSNMSLVADSLSGENDLAPLQFTRDVAAALLRLNEYFMPYAARGNRRIELSPEVVCRRIPMDNKLPPQTRKKLTVDEAKQRLLEEYGPGPVMKGSSSTYAGQWDLRDAEYYYTREYQRRDDWRRKYEEKHGVLPARLNLETFPQYLRRMANEIECRGPMTNYRHNFIDWSKYPQWKKE
jgi:hypothetical protein